MKKLIQDKKGNPITIDLTADEIAQLQADYIINRNWHYKAKPIRIILNFDSLRAMNTKKEFNESINQLHKYFKSSNLQRVEVGDDLFVYLDELHPEHRAVIEKNGGKIETKD